MNILLLHAYVYVYVYVSRLPSILNKMGFFIEFHFKDLFFLSFSIQLLIFTFNFFFFQFNPHIFFNNRLSFF